MTPLPCPFCGRAPVCNDRAEESATGRIWYIVCYCGSHSARAHQWGHTAEGVIEKWNKRSTPPEVARKSVVSSLDEYAQTPRTDAAVMTAPQVRLDNSGGITYVRSDFARQLEREAAALYAENLILKTIPSPRGTK